MIHDRQRSHSQWCSLCLGLLLLATPALADAQDGAAELYTVSPSSYSHWYGGGILGERDADGVFSQSRHEVLGSHFHCEDYLTALVVVNGEEGVDDQDLSIRVGLETRPSLSAGASLTLSSSPTFNLVSNRFLGDGRLETVNDPAHQADDLSDVQLIDRRLLPTTAVRPFDAIEEELSLLVSDVDGHEQLVIRLNIKVSCDTLARPKGELNIYLKSVKNSVGETLRLSSNSTVKIKAIEGLNGLGEPSLTLHSIAQLDEQPCPSLEDIRQAPVVLDPLSEETQMTLCHYMLNQGNVNTSNLVLSRVNGPDLEILREVDALQATQVEVISEQIILQQTTRLTTELGPADTANRRRLSSVRSQIFIPFITPNDSDGDGLSDSEEFTLGTNVFSIDSDADGLTDLEEFELGSPPTDADADDDGLLDGREGSLLAILNHDTDGDGIFDGTERGVTETGPDTDLSQGHFRPDLDPDTTSDHLSNDSDGGGCLDSEEDPNFNGRFDDDESDISDADDDQDNDQDGLYNVRERSLGSDENDADTDDDGVIDGDEPSPDVDIDGDGLSTINDADSDNDGLSDGLELGVSGDIHSDTDLSLNLFTPDLDPSTTTDPLNADSDGGGISDGDEDRNLNGRVDRLETDPLLGSDDQPDQDGDLIPNSLDNCPQLINPDQEDRDDDGLGDLCDDDGDENGVFDGLSPQRSQSCDQGSSQSSGVVILLCMMLLFRYRRALYIVLILNGFTAMLSTPAKAPAPR